VPPTRLAFIDVPRLLRELVLALLAEPADVIECRGDLPGGELARALGAHATDVVVAGDRLADPEEVCRLLAARPAMQVIVVRDGGRRCDFYELRPSRTEDELSAQSLRATVRRASLGWRERLA
jgi:hypothetical protein